MGWAGPAQPTGPDSAPKVLGWSRPKMDWADLGPTKSDILFWARPGPERQGWARTSLAQQQNWRGELFSPHPPTCRTLFVLHAGNKTKRNNEGGRRITWRGGGCASLVCRLRWRCCGGSVFLPPFCFCLVLLLLISGVFFCQLFVLLCVQWSPLSVVPSLSHCFPSSLSARFCFFSSVLLCFRFLLLFFTGLLLTEMAMAAGGGGEEVLCSWWCCCGWEEDGELSSVLGSALQLFPSPA